MWMQLPDSSWPPSAAGQSAPIRMLLLPCCWRSYSARLAAKPRQWRPRKRFEDLVKRRAEQNPRLSPEWMRYFAFHCARETAEGWIWKVDPRTTMGFGPWHPDWIAHGWRELRAPLLAITGDTPDAWGPCDEPTLSERLRFVKGCERAVVPDAGHFVHMERPRETARLVLDFLSS